MAPCRVSARLVRIGSEKETLVGSGRHQVRKAHIHMLQGILEDREGSSVDPTAVLAAMLELRAPLWYGVDVGRSATLWCV